MFDKWFKLPAHYYLHVTALSLLIIGVSLSNVLMSIGTIWIIANSLIEMDFKAKWERFKSNKKVIAISSLFLLMLFSMAWSKDLSYAFKDVMIKLPLITIPLVMGTSKPLQSKVYNYLLYLFLGTLAFTTIFNHIRFNSDTYGDIRAMSFFISHIRLGGLICLAIFLGGYSIYKRKTAYWFTLPIMVWLIVYLYLSQILSAYVLFSVLFLVTLFYFFNNTLRIIMSITLVLVCVLIGNMLTNSLQEKAKEFSTNSKEVVNLDSLDLYTVNGNSYYHDIKTTTTENGNRIWLYVSVDECEEEWNKRSQINYDSTNAIGEPIYAGLYRYMASKNIRKDSIGFLALSNSDIKNIENGQTNYKSEHGLEGKLNEVYFEYLDYIHTGNPNGNSLAQRYEHLRTALSIVKENWVFGVGIGDVNTTFQEQYTKLNSKLDKAHRLRAHNQFFTIWISLGLIGFALVVFVVFSPLFDKNITFEVIIVTFSMIFAFFTQDMIETQAGVTIFALFYALVNFKEKENG